jgi:para-nitrobenzyl esterase
VLQGRTTLRQSAVVAATGFVLASLLLASACRRHRGAPASGGVTADAHEDPAGAPSRDVTTDHGVVRGVLHEGVFAFRGIPYAAPPVGERRFAPPADAPAWPSPREANDWGACCPQLADGKAVGQEDCLTLNVWTPQGARASTGGQGGTRTGRPVLVFIHGGGNIQGCSAQEGLGQRTYEGAGLAAARDVVVVTMNYRLGVLGFLEHAALPRDATNLGLRDQAAALRWVQRNIGAFGGDPKRVLLFGESAGAEDTCAQLVSPASRGLFSSALMESAQCPDQSLAAAEKQGADVAAKLGCGGGDVLACLRAKPVDALVTGAPGATLFEKGIKYAPVVDGDVLPKAPLAAIGAGEHHHVPFAVGSNSEETLLWLRDKPMLGELGYRLRLDEMLGKEKAAEVLARYPVASYPDAKEAFIAATTDAVFACPARTLARAMAKAQQEPVYRYYFSHALATRHRAPEHGAVHGLELLFVWGQLHPNGYRPTDGETALSRAIQGYWARLAAGDPNGEGARPWPRYHGGDPYLVLDDPVGAGTALHAANCDFWDSVGLGR